jgi:transcriptional regulator with XRE-family HTH domain
VRNSSFICFSKHNNKTYKLIIFINQMPFNSDALRELMNRRGLNQKGLERELKEFIGKQHIEKGTKFSQSHISNLLNGLCEGSIRAMDILHLYAQEYNFDDLNFYIPPNEVFIHNYMI